MQPLVFVFMLQGKSKPGKSFPVFATAILLTVLLALAGGCRRAAPSAILQPEQVKSGSPSNDLVVRNDVGFATRRKFLDHYEKHGGEFGSITKEEYLHLAQSLRDRTPGGDVLEAKRDDGVITRFDRKAGAFLAFNPDLTIRTYFKPNDGEAYFKRQSRRGSARSSTGGDNE